MHFYLGHNLETKLISYHTHTKEPKPMHVNGEILEKIMQIRIVWDGGQQIYRQGSLMGIWCPYSLLLFHKRAAVAPYDSSIQGASPLEHMLADAHMLNWTQRRCYWHMGTWKGIIDKMCFIRPCLILTYADVKIFTIFHFPIIFIFR